MFRYSGKLTLPIVGFVGMNGSGKTALAVADALDKARGRTLYTSTPITPPEDWEGEVVLVESMSQFESMQRGHVLLDEISSILPARGTSSLPAEMVLLMSSLRHRDLTLAWTAPTIEHCDVNIRRVTQGVVTLKAIYSRRSKVDAWPQTKLSFVRSYDFRSYADFKIKEGSRDRRTPVIESGFLRISRLPLSAYDTHAQVALVADHMICSDCGGAKRKPSCSCGSSRGETAARKQRDGKYKGRRLAA